MFIGNFWRAIPGRWKSEALEIGEIPYLCSNKGVCKPTMSSTCHPPGGWAPEEHSQFVKLRERYFKEGLGTKGGREAALARIAPMLPGRDMAAVMRHDDWFVAARMFQRRRRDVVDAWGRERRQFLEDSESFLQESSRVNREAAEVAAGRLAHELVREGVREELEELRAARMAEWEAGAEARSEAAAAEASRLQAAEEQAEQLRAVKKDMIVAYREVLDRKVQEDDAARRAEAQAEAEARAERSGFNAERVEWRQAEHLWKVEKQQEERQAQQALETERRERLDRLRALVAPQVRLPQQGLWTSRSLRCWLTDGCAEACTAMGRVMPLSGLLVTLCVLFLHHPLLFL